jgi:hypothetical protein
MASVDSRAAPVTSAPRSSAGWELLWIGLVAFLMAVPNLFAFQQYRATGGYLFYSGAFDEPTYLSYEGALATRSFTHLGEHLVVLLHNLGLSGGYINLLFDLTLPLLTMVMLRAIATAIGWSRAEAITYPVIVVAAPVLLGYSNPYYGRAYDALYHSSGLKWITLPQAYYPPFFRSPEPQLSLFVAATAIYAALRSRSYLPLFIVAPVLYPFVGIPFCFVVLGLWLTAGGRRWPIAIGREIAAIIAFAAVAAAVGVFFLAFIRRTALADYLPPSRLPLISGTGLAAIGLYLIVRRRLSAELRDAAFFLALAPLVAVNTQVIAGVFEAPHNFEQNFGVVALGVLLVLSLRTIRAGPWLASATAALACVLLAVYSTQIFRVNGAVAQQIAPPPALVEALNQNPESVVIGDPDLADIFSLIAPRTRFSALARSQILRSEHSAEHFARYLCTRELIRQQNLPEVLPAAFALLDAGYRYQGQDFPLLHLRRREQFRQVFDPASVPGRCETRQLLVFPSLVAIGTNRPSELLPALAEDGKWSTRRPGAALLTSPAPWAYSATTTITPAAPAVGSAGKLADVRARLTVETGCIGIGVLTPERDAFLRQVSVEASTQPQTADVVFQADARPHGVVVFNCSQRGASTAIIDSIDLLHVDVAVRFVPAHDRRFSS